MRPYKKTAMISVLLAALLIVCANLSIMGYEQYTQDDISRLPVERACLVLGTSKFLANGKENLFYTYRIEAAGQAYHAGKCAKIVVSGDNRHKNYNEPEAMKKSLAAQGVPRGDIYCDYAGIRTLDSVLRFKYIFGQSSGIVISQKFHNARAIYIGKAHGINLTGFNAREVDAYTGFRTGVREIFSRVRAVADVQVLHSEPRHYGGKIAL